MNWKTILKNTPDDINWEEITGGTREYWKDWMQTEYEGFMRELRRNVEYAGNYFSIGLRNQMGELMNKAHIHKGNNEIFEFAVIIKFIEEEIEPLLRDAISQKKRDRANKRRRRR